MNIFSGDQLTELRCCDQTKMFSVQTTLVTRPGLGNQTCYNIPGEQLLTSGKRGCSLDNSPEVNHNTAKQQIKQKKLRTYVTHIKSGPQHYSPQHSVQKV